MKGCLLIYVVSAHTCQRVPIVFACMCAFVFEYERCVFACGYWSLCVCSVCVCLCVREGLFVHISAVSGWVPPRSCPSGAICPIRSWPGQRRRPWSWLAREECALGRVGSASAAATAPTLPFKSVSKPITADLPRDVLPSVSRSALPEDSPPAAARHTAQPAAGGSAPATTSRVQAPSEGCLALGFRGSRGVGDPRGRGRGGDGAPAGIGTLGLGGGRGALWQAGRGASFRKALCDGSAAGLRLRPQRPPPSPPRPAPSPCRRACATTRGTPCTWPFWRARRAPSAAS